MLGNIFACDISRYLSLVSLIKDKIRDHEALAVFGRSQPMSICRPASETKVHFIREENFCWENFIILALFVCPFENLDYSIRILTDVMQLHFVWMTAMKFQDVVYMTAWRSVSLDMCRINLFRLTSKRANVLIKVFTSLTVIECSLRSFLVS